MLSEKMDEAKKEGYKTAEGADEHTGIQCRRNRRRENAPTEVARTGHRGQKGSPYPTSPIEGEGNEAAFPIRHTWRIQKREMPNRERGSPYPTSHIEGEGNEAAFPIRNTWRIQKGNAERGNNPTPTLPSREGEGGKGGRGREKEEGKIENPPLYERTGD